MQQNQRLDEFRSKISEETTNILRKWLWADYQIYDTFNSHLTERINEYGQDRMTNDLTTFRQLNTKLKKDCQVQKVDNNQLLGTDLHMGNNMVQAYNVTQECKLYATSEPSFSTSSEQIKNRKIPGHFCLTNSLYSSGENDGKIYRFLSHFFLAAAAIYFMPAAYLK